MSEFLEFVRESLDKYLVNFDENKISSFYPYFFYNLNTLIDNKRKFFQEIVILLECLNKNENMIKDIKTKCFETIIDKSNDYSNSKDRYSSFHRTCEFLNIHKPENLPSIIFYSNMCQKIARIENLLQNNIDPKNESLIDSFIDLINYRLLFEGYKMGLQ